MYMKNENTAEREVIQHQKSYSSVNGIHYIYLSCSLSTCHIASSISLCQGNVAFKCTNQQSSIAKLLAQNKSLFP